MSGTRRFTTLAVSIAAVLATPATALEPRVLSGETLEVRLDGDFNGDGAADLAYVASSADWRELRVELAGGVVEALDLGTDPLRPMALSFEGNILTAEDLTGGTTAYASSRRYRFDGLRNRMRLIGMDVTLYSRTYAHDGFELSWNLLNGDTEATELKLDGRGTEATYDHVNERRFKRRTAPLWLSDTPDPEQLLDETSQD